MVGYHHDGLATKQQQGQVGGARAADLLDFHTR